jgi:AcrR family transcriptional regulator
MRNRSGKTPYMQNTDTFGQGKPATEERILSAAATLFSKLGYNGVSTRDIASAASVNEVTVYRHYPRKRDLYMAVMDAELRRVSLRGDLLAKIAHATDARKALTYTFEVISSAVLREPALLRLVLYSSLELRTELDAMLRSYLGELVEVVTHYIEPWIARGELRCSNAKGLVFALIAIVGFYEPLYLSLSGDTDGLKVTFEAFAETCLGVSFTESNSQAVGGQTKTAEA